ncbi:MAG: cell envelope integrity protein CreD [Balneolaceae bacterium]
MKSTSEQSIIENAAQAIRRSVTIKLFSIFILMLLLLIPMSFVRSLIDERDAMRESAINEVTDKWAKEQHIYGPVLTIPFIKQVLSEGEVKEVRTEAHILPSKISVNGTVEPQSLHRGIYEVVVYDSELSFEGNFNDLSRYLAELKGYEVNWEEAFLTINISDLRGIKEKVVVNWNGKDKTVDPGSNISPLIKSGITIHNIFDQKPTDESFDFSFDLQLQGSQYMGFVPLGRETNIKLSSKWPDPSFTGSFLPDERTVTENGFSADYTILELNRNYPQFWIGTRNIENVQKSSFGVDLLLPMNDYQKAMRSAKYALLAISLTFLTFFLIEIFNKREVHPFQYILIGLALVLFYTLLVSISEYTNFNIAYFISSISIISIIGLYAKSILKDIRQTIFLILILCATYTFVYITLQIQEYALLIGSIGLTSILAFTMFITRNINWYNLKTGTEPDPLTV